ncbi:hypothetical protein GCM10009839_90000 [Catenulispora yoronensis]|uniref:Uncharacterized protein n=1 Tax=Catenulispora yoronensis TaxID=450799 RepID=A0ABN2VKG0_9ACTN
MGIGRGVARGGLVRVGVVRVGLMRAGLAPEVRWVGLGLVRLVGVTLVGVWVLLLGVGAGGGGGAGPRLWLGRPRRAPR